MSGVDELMEELSRTPKHRCGVHKKIIRASEKSPQKVYKHWDEFVKLLDSENSLDQLYALTVLANLAKVDAQNKFEKIFEKFYGLLYGKSSIAAVYVAKNSWKIVKAKPGLERKVTKELLKSDKTPHQEHMKAILKAEAIASFDKYFKKSKFKKEMLKFAESCLKSKSPKCRRTAKSFLVKWEGS
jgi:hypothetical protein